MNDHLDPPRLAEGGGDVPPELKKLLTRAQDDVGTSTQMSRLEGRLAAILWAPGAAAPLAAGTGAAHGSAAAAGALVKIGAVVAAIGTAGGVYWATAVHTPAPRETDTATVPSETVEPASEAPEAPSDPAREMEKRPPAVSRNVAPHPAVPPETMTEAALLNAAQAALASDPARAFALAEQHRRKFTSAVLGQERDVISIEALERLGRHTEAKARAERFLKTYPRSAHRSKVQSVIGAD